MTASAAESPCAAGVTIARRHGESGVRRIFPALGVMALTQACVAACVHAAQRAGRPAGGGG